MKKLINIKNRLQLKEGKIIIYGELYTGKVGRVSYTY
ncbi:hypothetical protein VT91_25780 [Clostridium sporogenes]|nr:hypothetical protein NPD3_1539 [Clostridium botulinum]KRU25252.1 hypothetical protein WG71_32070 [Clostridium sporogenes]KRU28129.1 hypothetical protein VT91_25780 [Clostridium sporogenes]KRU28835.1 hypothetical protein VT28_22030 [Clostridium sporogenes]KRU40296.1 hypothetical protein VT95_27530 [Clostridium sporogenes]